jgi:transcriptional regulator with XRE-family HTH domain
MSKVLIAKLKALRKEQKITQNELSKKLGFSERYIAKIESGTSPSLEALRKIADFFHVPLEYLISENEALITTIPIKNKELLKAFLKVDAMNSEDQKVILELIKAFIIKGTK